MSAKHMLTRVMARSIVLNDGHRMPLLGLGTYKITGSNAVTECLDVALANGYRLFDTAHYYENEQEIGDALKVLLPKHQLTRSDLFITTKLMPDDRQIVLDGVAASLKRLSLDYIDLMLIHSPAPTKREGTGDEASENRKVRLQTWAVLEECKAAGQVRSIGVSNYEIRHLQEILSNSKTTPTVNQCEFHPHFVRTELRKFCVDNSIHFQAFASLGRFSPDLINEPAIVNVANEQRASVEQVLLAWAMAQDVSVLPKSTNPQRLASNFGSVKLNLTSDQVAAISASNRDKPYTRVAPWNVP